VYRRFGFLQSRLLLNKQDKLRELEEALDGLDQEEAAANVTWPKTRDIEEQHSERRERLLTAIEGEYTSYGKFHGVDASRIGQTAVLDPKQQVADFVKQIFLTLELR
jgi:hypothetical protein